MENSDFKVSFAPANRKIMETFVKKKHWKATFKKAF